MNIPFPFRGSINSRVKSEAAPSFFSAMIFSLSSATDNWSPLKLSFSYSMELLKRNRTQDMVQRPGTQHVRFTAVLQLESSRLKQSIHTLWGFDCVGSFSSCQQVLSLSKSLLGQTQLFSRVNLQVNNERKPLGRQKSDDSATCHCQRNATDHVLTRG